MRADFTNATIVLIGSFEPDAFRPNALADAKIISQKEGKLAKFITLIPDGAVHFQLTWGEVLVSKDRFQISANEAPYVRICDFVMKSFFELPSKSTVRAFGINLESHFSLGNVEARDALGQRIAPPNVWGKWGKELLESMKGAPEKHGGVLIVQMRQPFVEDKVSGWFDVRVGPSSRVPNHSGVFFRTNHHHQFPVQSPENDGADQLIKTPPDGLDLLDLLAERFDDSILRANNIFDDVLNAEKK